MHQPLENQSPSEKIVSLAALEAAQAKRNRRAARNLHLGLQTPNAATEASKKSAFHTKKIEKRAQKATNNRGTNPAAKRAAGLDAQSALRAAQAKKRTAKNLKNPTK